MKCSNCGSEMTPVDDHCSICGAPLLHEIEYEPVADPVDEHVAENALEQAAADQKPIFKDEQEQALDVARDNILWQVNKELEHQKKKKKFDGKILGGMLILCLTLVVIFNLNQKQDGNTSGQNAGQNSAGSNPVSSGTGVYQSTATKLMQVEGTIYNNAGDSIEGLYDDDCYVYHFSYDKTHSSGVMVDNRENALYVTSDLKTVPISSYARRAEISFNGDYAYYISEVEYEYFLYIYDIKSGERYKIDEDVSEYVALSPDGTKIAYLKYGSDYTKKYLYVAGIDMKPELIVEDVNGITAVSNDGKTVFYEVYDEEYKTHEYVWCDGEVVTLSDEYPGYFQFDKDCMEVLYKDREHNYYYSSGMSEPLILEDMTFHNICFDVPQRAVSEYEYDSVIYDSESFAGVLISTYQNGMLVINEDMSMTNIGNNNYALGIHARHSDEDVYITCDEKKLLKIVRDKDGNIDKEVLIDNVRANELQANDDASVIWYIAYDEGTYKLYQLDENGDISKLFDDKVLKSYNAMKWDTDTQKLYVLCDDGCLYAMTVDGEVEEVTNNCDMLEDYTFNYPDSVVYEDSYGKYYISVFGRFVLFDY